MSIDNISFQNIIVCLISPFAAPSHGAAFSLFPNLPLSYTVIGSHNFNPLNSGFYIEYQRNKEQYKREDIAS